MNGSIQYEGLGFRNHSTSTQNIRMFTFTSFLALVHHLAIFDRSSTIDFEYYMDRLRRTASHLME